VQLGVKLLLKLLLVLNTILLPLHTSVVQVVGINFLARRFPSLRRVSLAFIWFLGQPTKNIISFLRWTPARVNFRNRLISLFLLLYFQLLKSSYLLLSHLLIVKLVIYELLCRTFLLPVRIGNKCALFLLRILNFLFNFVDLLFFPVQKSLLSSDELVFLLVFLSTLSNFPLRNHKMCCVTINVLNVITYVSFVGRLNHALLILLFLDWTRISFWCSNRKGLFILHLF
jgi:hypothetical protein